jgi:hypothetical protein
MKLPRRIFLHLAAGAAALPAVSRVAQAQAYPSRPCRAAGGLACSAGASLSVADSTHGFFLNAANGFDTGDASGLTLYVPVCSQSPSPRDRMATQSSHSGCILNSSSVMINGRIADGVMENLDGTRIDGDPGLESFLAAAGTYDAVRFARWLAFKQHSADS